MSGSNEPSLAVDPLQFNTEDLIHATCIGNTIFFAPSDLKPSQFPSYLQSEEHDLHLIKKGLEDLKNEIKMCPGQLISDQTSGQTLSYEDQDWLDNGGNLINEQLVVNILLSLEEFKSLSLGINKCKTLQSVILSYQSTLSKKSKNQMGKQNRSKQK